MILPNQVQQHPASVDAYIRHGWSLVPIPMGTKGPRTPGWNIKTNALRSQADLPQGFGIGLAHAYSGTMALDIDSWPLATTMLHAAGVNLEELYNAPDAVVVDSGKQGHGKLLYQMPFGLALPSKKILQGKVTVYELRCATANGLTVQDVLPPSIHPETLQPYRWAGKGHWMRLPTIPQPLLDLWQGMLEQDKQRVVATGEGIDASWDEIRLALEHVSPDVSRDEWVNIGMALHWAGTQTNQLDNALALWNDWSAQSQTKYPGEREILTQWASFKTDKITAVKLGTLFHIAKRHGWTRPEPDVTTLFSAVGQEPMKPIDVHQGIRPPPPDLDFDLIPKIVATRAMEISDAVGCDPLVPLFAGLSAVCGVADARTRLELMEGFKVPPVLWFMTLGDPADKKSPGSRPMLSTLKEIEQEDRPRYQKELLDWEGKEAAYAGAKKSFLEFAASPEAMMSNAAIPTVPELPKQPAPLKITVSDITSQKLVRHAADRPRGLLCYLDEMNSWVRKLTDKTSGEDRSTWVVSYESEPYEMDRVGAGSIHCDNLAVSIYGNIQPTVFRQNLALMASDGLLQRFIPAVLRSDKTKLGNPVPEYMTSRAQWDQTLRMIYALPALTYKMSPEAHQEYREFQRWYESSKRDERLLQSSDVFMTAFGKLEGTTGRLILVFHMIENPYEIHVSADLVKRVVQLVKSYVIPSLRYALGEVVGTSSFDVWVTDFVIQHCDKKTITLSEVKRSARRPLDGMTVWQQDQMVMSSMQVLENVNWVVRLDDGSKENQHHAVWAINPDLATKFKDHRAEVVRAKQRQLDEIYKLSTKEKPKVYGIDDLD